MSARVWGWALAAVLGVGVTAPTPAAAGVAPDAPRVTYACSFKGSVPAYVQIEVSQNGAASVTVREHDADAPQTLHFTASAAAVHDIFARAAALHEFTRPQLEARQKVAYTGDKMLAYDDATQHHAQQFNYTTVAAAAALETEFENMAATAVDTLDLERAMRYQPLDTLGVLDQIQQDQSAGRLGEPQILEPVLRQVAASPALMEAARRHATALLKALEAAPR